MLRTQSKIRTARVDWRRWLIAVLLTSCCVAAQAQEATNEPPVFELTVTPQEHSFIITETVNEFTVEVNNATLFTNVVITGRFGTNVVGFTPPTTGSVYNANIRAPLVTQPTESILNLEVIGDDIAITNAQPDSTNDFTVRTNVAVSYNVVPRPPNDNMTNAVKMPLTGGVVTAVNHFASVESGEPKHGRVSSAGASLWWNWSSAIDTEVLVDIAGTEFPGIVAVYTGTKVGSLIRIGSSTNDLVNNIPPNVRFTAERGTTYRIAVSSFEQPGNVLPPILILSTNDPPLPPVVEGPESGGVTGTLRLRVAPGATPDTRPPHIQIDGNNRSLLTDVPDFVFSGTAREQANDSGISEVFFRLNGIEITNAQVSMFESGPNTFGWDARLTIPLGTNVVEALARDYAGNVSSPDQMVVRYIDPLNDYFANSLQLTGTGGLESANTFFATREPNEPLHANNDGGHSVWYQWQAPADGQLSLTTSGSSFDTLLAIYQGNELATLNPIASNDDESLGSGYSALTQNVVSNELYQIAVDGFGGDSGTLNLNYFFESVIGDEFFTLEINPTAGGMVSPRGGAFPVFSRIQLTAIPEPNFSFVRWEGSVASTENPLNLTITANMELTPHFTASEQLTDDFETGDLSKLPWDNDGSIGWLVVENDEDVDVPQRVVNPGKFKARSGSIQNDNKSRLVLETNTSGGTASFDVRVSCEEDWDFLDFFLDDSILRRWTGEIPWENFQFEIPPGRHRLEWVYSKDGSFSRGDDAAYIDNFYVPPPPPPSGSGPHMLIFMFAEGAQITLEGNPNIPYVIEASDDLDQWTPIATKQSVSGVIHILDTSAPGRTTRFYRGRPQ